MYVYCQGWILDYLRERASEVGSLEAQLSTSYKLFSFWSTVFIRIKAGLKYTQGSNIHWVVQQNERNKHLGLLKHRVPKLLNLINVKIIPNDNEN